MNECLKTVLTSDCRLLIISREGGETMCASILWSGVDTELKKLQ